MNSAPKEWINDRKNNFFCTLSSRLRSIYIVDAKNWIFAIFSALAILKKFIFSDISGCTLVFAPVTNAHQQLIEKNAKIKKNVMIFVTEEKTYPELSALTLLFWFLL